MNQNRYGFTPSDHANAVALYVANKMAPREIARQFNISLTSLRHWCVDAGVARTGSEELYARWARGEQPNTKAANEATRGRKANPESLIRAAATRQSIGTIKVSKLEIAIAKELRKRGVSLTAQLAVGPYLADIAIGSVAVEIWSGYWHLYGEHAGKFGRRIREFTKRGYSTLIIWNGRCRASAPFLADQIIANINLADGSPAGWSKYRVIRCRSNSATVGSFKSHQFARIRASIKSAGA